MHAASGSRRRRVYRMCAAACVNAVTWGPAVAASDDGEVEVAVRPVAESHPTVGEMLALVATFPPGGRTKEDIDRQIAEERASWDRG
jgi:hypothetical protein